MEPIDIQINLSNIFNKTQNESLFNTNFLETTFYKNLTTKTSESRSLETKDFTIKDSYSKYIYSHKLGLSFYFNDSENPDFLKEIYVYNKDKKFSKFINNKPEEEEVLPYKICIDWKNSDFVSFFGEPDSKSGGRSIPIC